MDIKLFLHKIYNNLVIGTIKNTEEMPDVGKWMRFLDELGSDNDPINESYRKYRCRMTYYSVWKKIIINFLSFCYLVIFPYKMYKKKIEKDTNNTALLVEFDGISSKDIFPEILYGKYSEIRTVNYKSLNDRLLTNEIYDIYRIIMRRFLFHPYYLLLLKESLALISNCIKNNQFSAIIVYDNERDIASPIITDYLEKNNVRYISFMHGEYILQILQAHMCFSEYYIWNKTYIDMFMGKLRCNIHHYYVYTPQKLQKKWELEKEIPDHFMTYYLSGESEITLKKLSEIFQYFKNENKFCKVRPHPRYSHYKLITRLFDAEMIENPKEVDLKTSLANTRYVLGLITTVLNEAYIEGKDIVIDDITNPAQFENLKNRNFVALNIRHELLSNFIKR